MFRKYAEQIPEVTKFASTPKESLSESVAMLSSVAREAGVWLIGGELADSYSGKKRQRS